MRPDTFCSDLTQKYEGFSIVSFPLPLRDCSKVYSSLWYNTIICKQIHVDIYP